MKMTRRRFAAAASTLAVTAGQTGCTRSAPSSKRANPLAINQGFQDFVAYFRIMSDFGGGTTFRFHSGSALLVPAPRQLALPFVDFVSIKQDRTRRLPNGDFQHAYKGVTLFTGLKTGEVIDSFRNPASNEVNQVKHFATSGGSIVYTPTGAYQLKPKADPNDTPDIGLDPVEFGWGMAGEDTWITYPERFSFKDADGKVVGADNSMYRYLVDSVELANADVANVDAVMSWQTETGLWPWMQMEGHPGHLIFGSIGKKYNSIDAIPERYLLASESRFPGQLEEQIAWSDFVVPLARR